MHTAQWSAHHLPARLPQNASLAPSVKILKKRSGLVNKILAQSRQNRWILTLFDIKCILLQIGWLPGPWLVGSHCPWLASSGLAWLQAATLSAIHVGHHVIKLFGHLINRWCVLVRWGKKDDRATNGQGDSRSWIYSMLLSPIRQQNCQREAVLCSTGSHGWNIPRLTHWN